MPKLWNGIIIFIILPNIMCLYTHKESRVTITLKKKFHVVFEYHQSNCRTMSLIWNSIYVISNSIFLKTLWWWCCNNAVKIIGANRNYSSKLMKHSLKYINYKLKQWLHSYSSICLWVFFALTKWWILYSLMNQNDV